MQTHTHIQFILLLFIYIQFNYLLLNILGDIENE